MTDHAAPPTSHPADPARMRNLIKLLNAVMVDRDRYRAALERISNTDTGAAGATAHKALHHRGRP